MKLADNLYSLYIRNILIPKAEDFSHPGYVLARLTRDSRKITLRDVFIPEDFIVELEKTTIDKFGETGRELLYKIGKNGGYIYSNFSGLDTLQSFSDIKKFEEYLSLLILYLAGTYAADVDYDFNNATRVLKQSFSDYIVCPKNGIGELVITGSAAGIWAWLLQDKTLEGIHTTCIGRGEKSCSVVLGPPAELTSLGLRPFHIPELIDLDLTEDYLTFNEPLQTEFIQTSLDSLIDSQVINFKDGRITFHDVRFFEWDAHYIYLLEQFYPDNNLLFNLAKDHHRTIADNIGDKLTLDYISTFLGALGWGDIGIYDGPQIQIRHYPYTDLYRKSNFSIIRGMLSGFLTAYYKKDVSLSTANPLIDDTGFSLIIN